MAGIPVTGGLSIAARETVEIGPAGSWDELLGAPFTTVSPVGIADGYPRNNGANYGPDTVGTTTVGIDEAAVGGGPVLLLQGTFKLTGGGGGITVSTKDTHLMAFGYSLGIVSGVVIEDDRNADSGHLITISGAGINNVSVEGISIKTDHAQVGFAQIYVTPASGGQQGIRIVGCCLNGEGNADYGIWSDGGNSNGFVRDCVLSGFNQGNIYLQATGGAWSLGPLNIGTSSGNGIILQDIAAGPTFIHHANITNCASGIWLYADTVGVSTTYIDGCEVSQNASDGLRVSGTRLVQQLRVTGTTFGTSTNNVNWTAQAIDAHFTGCSFRNATQDAIYLSPNQTTVYNPGISFDGCTVYAGGQSASGYAGINVAANVYLMVSGGEIGDGTHSGGPTMSYAINFSGELTGGLVSVQGTRMVGLLSGTPVFNAANAAGFATVEGCPGYNPQGYGILTPGVPLTTDPLTNNFLFPVRIQFLTASAATYTVTDPLGNTGPSVPIIAGGFEILDPGAEITPTYATLTWKWYGG